MTRRIEGINAANLRTAHEAVESGTTIGKIVLDYPEVHIIDYMSLLKTNGEWKIINKIFMTEMKKK